MSRQEKSAGKLVVYQAKTGAIELRGDFGHETLWANLQQIATLFETDKSGISRHISGIFRDGELSRRSTVAKIATVQNEGGRQVARRIEYYNLDMILSVGYRVNSRKATTFRQWATKILRQHVFVAGYTINRKRLAKNYDAFLEAVEGIKRTLPSGGAFGPEEAVELVRMFAETWLSLDAYDKETLPKEGASRKQVRLTASDLENALASLKAELVLKGEASDLFGNERSPGGARGIVGNVLQSFGGTDLYPTVEAKAAHLLYFMVKNHPYTDGNKRSGAFAFVWFLRRTGLLDAKRLTPEALTVLTLLVAESNPKDKDRIIGLVLALL